MKFRRIFGRHNDIQLYSVFIPGEKIHGKLVDSFSKIFNNWNDTQYLLQVLSGYAAKCGSGGSKNIQIDKVFDEILDESARFESQLKKIENRETGYESAILTDLFKPLFKKVYFLDLNDLATELPVGNVLSLRLYALKLKGNFFITSGSIRLLNEPENELDEDEKWKLNEVCRFFKKKPVFDPWGSDVNKS